MHICHVNLASGFSGGERQTLQLIIQQLKKGYQLTVVANPKSPFATEIKKLNCKLVLASHFIKQHKKSITINCDVIHVHEGRAIYWALIQSKRFGVPYIVTRRIDNPLKNKLLSNIAYSNANTLIGLSREIVSKIKERHPSQLVYKIPSSPVSYSVEQDNVDTIWRRFSNKFLVIQAANLLHHKGHETTIEAAKLLQNMDSNIHIALLGDGPERKKLESLVEKYNLNNITFLGKQNRMGDWFSAADLLIHPSYSEGLGSVILEAISAKLPVIGSNAGGIPDIIDDQKSGLLVEPKDAQGLANAIYQVATNKPLRNKLIIGGQEKLSMFDIKHTSCLYHDIYQTIINGKSGDDK
ncbi:glycosyltransferase family 4 protein [Aliivibrio fischeri]|uniref:glycosyltransferase family 4 protein n=1 Tax=Aliivibrio fischeri TaxID=668 RepID=UPI0007C54429|nr:glycosyltransferase family 4 protein [Aliivibrio fischeri]